MSRDGRLPPGQAKTAKFPVVGEKAPLPQAFDLASWRLEVAGLVEEPRSWTYAELLALPQRERRVDIHCVTGWSQFEMVFTGLPLAELLSFSRPKKEARFVSFEAYSDRRHDTSLPLELALEDTWLVHGESGEPLAPEHGWPLRTLTPSRYFYKSLKWLHRIELLEEDKLGYWERESAYHNVGDPWPGDQRFTTGSLKPAEAERFKNAENFRPWRGKVLLGLDLRGWQPKSDDLQGIELKNCDLREARIAGKNLAGANLSLSDLREADLRGTSLEGADVEGVNFAGADLRGATLDRTALSATRFFEEKPDGSLLEAKVAGMSWLGGSGLLEDQESFLKARC
jgi:DMSO/TMAO reductase YedYZ molybdopterin-dependent catalytic subunit